MWNLRVSQASQWKQQVIQSRMILVYARVVVILPLWIRHRVTRPRLFVVFYLLAPWTVVSCFKKAAEINLTNLLFDFDRAP